MSSESGSGEPPSATGTGIATAATALVSVALLYATAFVGLGLGQAFGLLWSPGEVHLANDWSITALVFLGIVWLAALWCVIAFAGLVSATFGGSKAVACASALIVFGGLSVGLGYVLATYEFG